MTGRSGGYRDELAAAQESRARIASAMADLEAENGALRAENERLRSARGLSRAGRIAVVVALASAGFGLAAALGWVAHAVPPVRVLLVEAPPKLEDVPAAVPPAYPALPRDQPPTLLPDPPPLVGSPSEDDDVRSGCNPPYRFDAAGKRRFKRHCIDNLE